MNQEDGSRRMLATRAELFRADADLRQAAAAEAGQSSVKAPFLANGGAILALLTFIGNTQATIDATKIWWSFASFGVGFICAMIAHWTHYRSLGHLTVHARYSATQLDNPDHIKQFEQRARDSEFYGVRFRTATAVLLVVSMLLFLSGAFLALGAIT